VNVDRLSDFIYTRSRLIIAFVVVMNLIALASLTRFAIDTDITGFFTAGNKVYDEYLALTEKYDISESVVVLIEDTESLLAADNMLAVHELVTAIEALP